MVDMFSVGTGTQVCAVIGNPVAHSLSPAVHNAAFRELDLDFIYVAFRVDDIKNALAGFRALENFRGLSVTIPHKTASIPYVDDISESDRRIGSINTVIHDKRRLRGLGTDGPGALKAFRDAGVEPGGKTVLMLGSGGVARAIAFTLALEVPPIELIILDIDESMRMTLRRDIKDASDTTVNTGFPAGDQLAAAMERADIIVHCTPLGMHPREGESLVPRDLFRSGQVVFDAVYTPLETKLLSDAAAKGLMTISGVDMFINQAVLQFEQFTGEDAPVEVMQRAVMERLT
ncbi:MAG: shikimate dehydrogenase [Desulfobacterales bacterium]